MATLPLDLLTNGASDLSAALLSNPFLLWIEALAEAEVRNESWGVASLLVAILLFVLVSVVGTRLMVASRDRWRRRGDKLEILGFILMLPALLLIFLLGLSFAAAIVTLIYPVFSNLGSPAVIGTGIVLVLLAVIILARRIFP